MGNVMQTCNFMNCFNQCFGRSYKRWSSIHEEHSSQFLQDGRGGSFRRLNSKRSRIREYLAWALNRSRKPLILDDQFAHRSLETESQDISGINTVSWISDAGSSDASHALYRELDPYNYAAVNQESLLPSPSSSYASDLCKSGSFVAVTKLTGTKSQTSTSLVFVPNLDESNPAEEEVDGLELARLARNMWSRCSSNRHNRNKMQQNTALRSATNIPSAGTHKPVQLESQTPVNEVPVDLDWDHEPGTASPHAKQFVIKRPQPPLSEAKPSKPTRTESNDCLQTRLFPGRPRRRNVVARLPVTGNGDSTDHGTTDQVKRWSYSDKLTSNASWLHPVPDSTKAVLSPPSGRPPDELFDSGFAGMGTSLVEDDMGIDAQSNDHLLLWENELFAG